MQRQSPSGGCSGLDRGVVNSSNEPSLTNNRQRCREYWSCSGQAWTVAPRRADHAASAALCAFVVLAHDMAAADAEAAAGYHASALLQLKEAWWQRYFTRCRHATSERRLVEMYHELRKTTLADAMHADYGIRDGLGHGPRCQ
jgi:hypothetical protein